MLANAVSLGTPVPCGSRASSLLRKDDESTRNCGMSELPNCETLLLERDGGVLHVTLNRPDSRNAMSLAMVGELRAVLARRARRPRRARHCPARRRRALLRWRRHQGHGQRPRHRSRCLCRAEPRLRRPAGRSPGTAAGAGRRAGRCGARRWLRPGLRLGHRHRGGRRAVRPAGNQPRHPAGADRALRGETHRPDPGPPPGLDCRALRWP